MIICTLESGHKAELRHAVVDTLVLKENKILLVKRTKKISEGGKWGLIGGYVSRNETIKETVEREVFEETGWRVKDITFFRIKDSPDRPMEDRQNIAFVFFCSTIKKEGEKDWESDEVEWFDLNSLPPKNEMAFDHEEDIKLYMKYLRNPFPLPIFN